MTYLITLYVDYKDEFITDCSTDVDGAEDLADRIKNVTEYYERKFLCSVKVVSVTLLGGLNNE